MKIREIAGAIGKTYQTVNSHIANLLANDMVRQTHREGNAQFYGLGSGTDNLARVIWNGKSVTISEILQTSVERGALPKETFARLMTLTLADLLNRAAKATDEYDPVPVTQYQLKTIQAGIAEKRKTLRALIKIYDDILSIDEFFTPRDLVKSLIINDPEMTVELAKSIAARIFELDIQRE
jgi:DNA-binding transcriptional ArsR family regulator